MEGTEKCRLSRLSKALSGFEGLLEGLTKEEVGVDDGEGTPVPIPNTAVKLTGADNTWLEAARDDRKTPTHNCFRSREGRHCSLAQSVEHAAVNRRVVGSSPTGGAKRKSVLERGRIFVCIIHYSFFIIHYSLSENGFSNEY